MKLVNRDLEGVEGTALFVGLVWWIEVDRGRRLLSEDFVVRNERFTAYVLLLFFELHFYSFVLWSPLFL